MTEPVASELTRSGGRPAEASSLASTGMVTTFHDDLRARLRPVEADEAAALPYAELVSSLDTTVDAVDLLYRCALVEGGGESVHLLTEATQGLHRAVFALRELAASASVHREPAGWGDASRVPAHQAPA